MTTIKIYTTPTCAFCKMAKEYFKSKELNYEEYDVSKDIPRQKEMIEKTGQFGVPVIDINGKIVIGFDKPKINDYLGIK
ncbi:MAG TPA: glutaredoxin domain-containing protein [Candidatus Paceibacterota bacterium]|nr:glutaredoxin domain-containing protein [Candidatus Paceibacterota bacterium]